MRAREFFTALGIVALLAIPALADLPCTPRVAPAVPLTLGGFLDEVLGGMLQQGIWVLFGGALAVAGLPWLMAGLAMALVQIARRKI
jgi:hypothetical protein